jgi:hypothetical protein
MGSKEINTPFMINKLMAKYPVVKGVDQKYFNESLKLTFAQVAQSGYQIKNKAKPILIETTLIPPRQSAPPTMPSRPSVPTSIPPKATAPPPPPRPTAPPQMPPRVTAPPPPPPPPRPTAPSQIPPRVTAPPPMPTAPAPVPPRVTAPPPMPPRPTAPPPPPPMPPKATAPPQIPPRVNTPPIKSMAPRLVVAPLVTNRPVASTATSVLPRQGTTIQDQLFLGIKNVYPKAATKKINSDNYLDITIADLTGKPGNHLFFNTAKNVIRIGFYVRDEAFVNNILLSSNKVTKDSNGLALKNNPIFSDINAALKAAFTLLDVIKFSNQVKNIPIPPPANISTKAVIIKPSKTGVSKPSKKSPANKKK